MSTNMVGTVASGAGKVGRYFTIVSLLPATVFVAYLYVLIRVGWSGPVRWSALTEAQWHEILLTGLAAIVLALTLNPLQFAMIQMFEGYWGTSALGVGLASIRILHHRRRAMALDDADRAAGKVVADHGGRPALELRSAGAGLVRAMVVAAESQRVRASYPAVSEILPTRLGNVLRRYEKDVGRSYRIDPLVTIPRLGMVGGEREVAYVQNQRVQLELAIRTAFVALCATGATLAIMGRHGLWLLLGIAPYTVAFFAYRGAVALAHEYGTSLAVLTDLGRFELYRRMGLRLPENTARERDMNTTLMDIFSFAPNPSLPYDPTEPSPPATEPIADTAESE